MLCEKHRSGPQRPIRSSVASIPPGGDRELRESTRCGVGERGGRGVTMQKCQLVAPRGKADRHGVQIDLDATGVAESVVREKDAHGGWRLAGNQRHELADRGERSHAGWTSAMPQLQATPSMAHRSSVPPSDTGSSRCARSSSRRLSRLVPRSGHAEGCISTKSASARPRRRIVSRAPRRTASSQPSTSILMKSGSIPSRAQKPSIVTTGTFTTGVVAVGGRSQAAFPAVPMIRNSACVSRSPTAASTGRTTPVRSFRRRCRTRPLNAGGAGSNANTRPAGPTHCPSSMEYAPTLAPTSSATMPGETARLKAAYSCGFQER